MSKEAVKPWYAELFDNYSKGYDEEEFTKGTIQEVDFLEEELDFDKSIKILDVGCGTGRHAVELARRGYDVTGVDRSEPMLRRAREKAAEAGVSPKFVCADARELPFESEFDFAMIICEGAFPLLETDEENFKILKSVYGALKSPGKFVLTTLNALFPLNNSTEEFNPGKTSEFDPLTFRQECELEFTDDEGNKRTVSSFDRFLAPTEISFMLKILGFDSPEIFGCQIGAFSRARKYSVNDFEMLVIARKP